MIIQHTITPSEHGTSLEGVLRRSLSLSAAAVRRLKRSDGIKLGGRTVFTNYKVSQGERLTVTLTEGECGIVPEYGRIDILYEDEWILAVNKSPGILVHPSRSKYTGTLSNLVYGYILSSGGEACHTVNRLDRDTSGVVLFSKSSYVKNLCALSLRQPESSKDYVAVVCGVPEKLEGVIDRPIRRKRPRDMMRIVAPDGDRAVTQYSVLARGNYLGAQMCIMSFRLMTGRTHQIRVHCHASGFPILGDGLYYTPYSKELSEKIEAQGQMLHSRRISLKHPITGEGLHIEAPIVRPVMAQAIEKITASGKGDP